MLTGEAIIVRQGGIDAIVLALVNRRRTVAVQVTGYTTFSIIVCDNAEKGGIELIVQKLHYVIAR